MTGSSAIHCDEAAYGLAGRRLALGGAWLSAARAGRGRAWRSARPMLARWAGLVLLAGIGAGRVCLLFMRSGRASVIAADDAKRSPKPPRAPMSPGRSPARTARCSTATTSIAAWRARRRRSAAAARTGAGGRAVGGRALSPGAQRRRRRGARRDRSSLRRALEIVGRRASAVGQAGGMVVHAAHRPTRERAAAAPQTAPLRPQSRRHRAVSDVFPRRAGRHRVCRRRRAASSTPIAASRNSSARPAR